MILGRVTRNHHLMIMASSAAFGLRGWTRLAVRRNREPGLTWLDYMRNDPPAHLRFSLQGRPPWWASRVIRRRFHYLFSRRDSG